MNRNRGKCLTALGGRAMLRLMRIIKWLGSLRRTWMATQEPTLHWQDAVIRHLEIIGEATKRLSQDLRSQHHEIPWRRIAGLRHV